MKPTTLYSRLLSFISIFLFCSQIFAQPVAGPDLTSPANNVLNYNYVKVTYSWTAVVNADVYELQVCKTDSFKTADGLKTYQNIDTTTYTPLDYLLYSTKYYWRVRAKIDNSYTDYSTTFALTVGSPKDSINDVNARIIFSHKEGRINEITFKNGSNKQLLDTLQNSKNKTGLSRITNETSTKLASWTENAGNYTYNYENSTYGSKSINIKWNADSIIVLLTLNLAAGKTAAISAAWKPGGDIGPLYDSIFYATPDDIPVKTGLTYPGGTPSTIFNDYANLIAISDSRFDEYFGYTSPDSVSTLLKQGLLFGPTFNFPSSASPQTETIKFGIMNKPDFFPWAGKKYLLVTYPADGITLKDRDSVDVKWESFGVTGNVNILLSTNGGSTFDSTLILNTPNADGHQKIKLSNLSASVPVDSCIIKVIGTGALGTSGMFTIVKNIVTVFSIPDSLSGAPTDRIMVPVLIDPQATDSLYAFDIRLEYDKDILTYLTYDLDSQFVAKNWNYDVTNNATAGYLQIGGFKTDIGFAVKPPLDTLMTLTFTIKSTARVGTKTLLQINNAYLSAADDSARTLNVLGIDGSIKIYSRVSGFCTYIISKKPIFVHDLVRFINFNTAGLGDTVAVSTSSSGFYDFSNMAPGNSTRIEPDGNIDYPPLITTSVDAVDAALAFSGRDGGSTKLTEIQKISADINCDGIISSTDALAILRISTGGLSASVFGVNNWVFIDSTFKLTALNWASAPQSINYSILDTVKTRQSFWGMVRGDVDGDGCYPTIIILPKVADDFSTFNTSSVLYDVPVNLSAGPGDTLYLPLNITTNGSAIGAFNASLSVDKNLLTYTGKFTEGTSLPKDKGWYVSTFFDQKGNLNIGATDFSGGLDPITTDGTIALFEFVVNDKAAFGDTSLVMFSYLSAADTKLTDLPVNGKNGKVTITDATTAVENDKVYEYSLAQNYPNPFNPKTIIRYSLKNESNVEIEIYNSIGERSLILFKGVQQAGNHTVEWNADKFASGIYFYRIKAGDFNQTRKMMLLK